MNNDDDTGIFHCELMMMMMILTRQQQTLYSNQSADIINNKIIGQPRT